MPSKVFPYWLLPLTSAVIWFAMILTMLVYWLEKGKPIYPSMSRGSQTIAYISDVGADTLKPLFISMGTASVVIFDLGFLAERWARHRGYLLHDKRTSHKILSGFAMFFSLAGAAGFILLSIFDTRRHRSLHDAFIGLFIGGYVICAFFVCAEYNRLGARFTQFRILRLSFWIKVAFIVIELALAIAFGILNRKKMWNTAAVVEWVIALIYTFWVISFIIDFLPAGRPEHHDLHGGVPNIEEMGLANNGSVYPSRSVAAHYPSGTTASGGLTNGHHHPKTRYSS